MKRPNFVTIFLIPAITGIVSLCCVTAASVQSEEHPWDVNGDGVVDINDLVFVGSHFGDSSVTSADVNGDGLVNIADLVLVGVHFGEEYEPTMPGPNEIVGTDGAPMVLIPAGEFMMGDHHGDADSDERPVHPVYLEAFYMDKYEVTNAQFKKFVEANPEWSKDGIDRKYHDGDYLEGWNGNNYPEGKGDHPVIWVSWYAAAAYTQWAGKRLPTEAEWERAARGTFIGEGNYKRYVWGDEWPPPEGAGNFNSQYIDGYHDDYPETAPVGRFNANGYGLHDMAGNVWEWCADEYSESYYSISPGVIRNPKGPGVAVTFRNNDFTNVNAARVLRGGSWYNRGWLLLRVAFRIYSDPVFTGSYIGFRCAGL